MKIIRNGVCFIEKGDIECLVLPENISNVTEWNLYYSIKYNLLRYKDDLAVQFFQNQKCILDYDDIRDLSEEELEELREQVNNRLNAAKGNEYLSKLLKHYIESIDKYVQNKESYDKEISLLSFSNFRKTKLKKYPVAERIEPVARIPVSSAKIFELDQSIKSKVAQNAYERIRGLEAAENYIVRSAQPEGSIEQGPVKRINK